LSALTGAELASADEGNATAFDQTVSVMNTGNIVRLS
jgi:hypothetical protein